MRTRGLPQPEPLAQRPGIDGLPLERLVRVVRRHVRIRRGIPDVVVEPVQDPGELVLEALQHATQAEALVGVARFPRVPRRHGRHEVGEDDGGLREVDHAGVPVVAHAVGRQEVVGTPEPGRRQDLGTGRPLVFEVVDGVAHPLILHPEALVQLEQERGDHSRLPVVGVDDVRPLAAAIQELQRRAAEERKPHGLVVAAVEGAAVEEQLIGVRVDEEAFAPVDEAEPHGAVHLSAAPRDPEVVEDWVHVPDVLVAQAVVLRQDDLDRVAADLELASQAVHHVAQPPHFGDRSALGRDHHDEHAWPSMPRPGGRRNARASSRPASLSGRRAGGVEDRLPMPLDLDLQTAWDPDPLRDRPGRRAVTRSPAIFRNPPSHVAPAGAAG